MSIKECAVDTRTIRAPFPASTAISAGDLLYWDDSANFAKAASARTDLTTTALNQADFTPLFLGIALDQRLSTETSVTVVASAALGPSDRTVALEGVFDCGCAAATFEIGDFVGVDRDSTNNVNYNQQVIKVTSAALAIGQVVKREPSNVTKVKCFLSALKYGWWNKVTRSTLQATGLIAASDADTTLTVAQVAAATIVKMTPTANPRKLILPAEAESKGFSLNIQNLAAMTNGIQVRDSGDANTIITVPAAKAGRVYCDGTTWFGMVGA